MATETKQKRFPPGTRIAKCRNCGIKYDAYKTRSEWTGYCSAKCQHEKAKKLGWRKNSKHDVRNEYTVLKNAKAVGDDLYDCGRSRPAVDYHMGRASPCRCELCVQAAKRLEEEEKAHQTEQKEAAETNENPETVGFIKVMEAFLDTLDASKKDEWYSDDRARARHYLEQFQTWAEENVRLPITPK